MSDEAAFFVLIPDGNTLIYRGKLVGLDNDRLFLCLAHGVSGLENYVYFYRLIGLILIFRGNFVGGCKFPGDVLNLILGMG